MNDVPDFVAVRDHVREELVRFVRALRRAGVAVPANNATTAARALVVVGFDDEATARAAVRACLITDAEDITTFDRQFSEFWRRLTAGLTADGPAPRQDDAPEGTLAPLGGDTAGRPDVPTPDETDAESADDGESVDEGKANDDEKGWEPTNPLGAVISTVPDEREREQTELRWYSPTGSRTAVTGVVGDERDLATAFDGLTRALATVRGRRWRAGGDDRADARRALRTSFSTGGTVVPVPHRERTPSEVRALWLVDVSRSVLDTVDRPFLLGTLRRARTEWRDASVFFFDEDCREASTSFDEPTAVAALDALHRAEAEWGGGTRIGASLAGLHERATDAVTHRTVVFVVSDGLEMGDVGRLEDELAWLARRAAGVLWLNPLAASPSYEPTARGMAAALPFVDGLFAFASPADLAEIGRQVRRYGIGGRIGYEYDPRRGSGDISSPAAMSTNP